MAANSRVLRLPAVVVLVGPPGSGKTTARRRLIALGLDPSVVVSLDDLRRALRVRSRAPRPLQDYSLPALRIAATRQAALLRAGRGYLADATHLRRRERTLHVWAAHAAGLPAVALVSPPLPLAELVSRDRLRPLDEQVPHDVLARHEHRRALLTPEGLVEDGFDAVGCFADVIAVADAVLRSGRAATPAITANLTPDATPEDHL